VMAGWEEIRAEVMARIRSRAWAPGALIPGEEALALEFGVARATVNRALSELARTGVLERRRKAGTRVAMMPVRKATLDIPVIRAEVEARGETYGLRLLRLEITRPPLSVSARLTMDSVQMVHLRTLHLASGRPFVVEDRWLNRKVLPDPMPDFAEISANEWLVAHVSFTTGDIAFSAEAACGAAAEALAVPEGTAVFVTERCTWSPDAPITWVRLVHAPGYRLSTVF
jgi:GntR family histidine utilization transcriptional repressor